MGKDTGARGTHPTCPRNRGRINQTPSVSSETRGAVRLPGLCEKPSHVVSRLSQEAVAAWSSGGKPSEPPSLSRGPGRLPRPAWRECCWLWRQTSAAQPGQAVGFCGTCHNRLALIAGLARHSMAALVCGGLHGRLGFWPGSVENPPNRLVCAGFSAEQFERRR